MIQIQGIDVLDGDKPTEAMKDLCIESIMAFFPKCNRNWAISWLKAHPVYKSLDAFRDVWESIIGDDVCFIYNGTLEEIVPYFDHRLRLAKPHHHLEAWASVLSVECPMNWQCKASKVDVPCEIVPDCPSCNGKGSISVLESWRLKWKK